MKRLREELQEAADCFTRNHFAEISSGAEERTIGAAPSVEAAGGPSRAAEGSHPSFV